jgi:hypothetical protein
MPARTIARLPVEAVFEGIEPASFAKRRALEGWSRYSSHHHLRRRAKERRFPSIAAEYRRLHVLLRREGHLVNHKRLFRIYRKEKLAVRRRGGRKRAMGTPGADAGPDVGQ